MENPDDVCPRPSRLPPQGTTPHAPPIYLSSVYECHDPTQADALLSGRESGYVYARHGHPNADLLAEKCRQLHGTERAAITSSGMAALALVVLTQLEPGDHVVVGNQLYGRTLTLFTAETARLGIASTVVEMSDLAAVERAITPRTRLLVVETISNPLLQVADLASLAHLRTAAAPRSWPTIRWPVPPSAVRASSPDWVMESITKSMNGHSDVILGTLCGPADRWQLIPAVLSTWGLASTVRLLAGITWFGHVGGAHGTCQRKCRTSGTTIDLILYNRKDLLSRTARSSRSSTSSTAIQRAIRIDCDLYTARWSCGSRGLDSGRAGIPFCPSLGELSTTLSHPASTSHRGLSNEARAMLGITEGTIRLSVGIESTDAVLAAVREALAGVV